MCNDVKLKEKNRRVTKTDGVSKHKSVTAQYMEKQSLASHIVSTQTGLTQGLKLHAVPVISSPSGNVGNLSSQSIAACCRDLRVGGLHLAEIVWVRSLLSPAHNAQGDRTSG